MLLDCTPVESFKLGWTSVTVQKKSIPRTAQRSCTLLTNSRTLCSLSLCQIKRNNQQSSTGCIYMSSQTLIKLINYWRNRFTFSFCSSWSWDWNSSNFFKDRSASSTTGLPTCSLVPLISPHIFCIWDCTSKNSFILSSFCFHSRSSAGAIAASCSFIVPEGFSGYKWNQRKLGGVNSPIPITQLRKLHYMPTQH